MMPAVTLDAMTTTRAEVDSSKGHTRMRSARRSSSSAASTGLPPEHLQAGLISNLLVGLHMQTTRHLQLPLPLRDHLPVQPGHSDQKNS
jgi:hypothetical protein